MSNEMHLLVGRRLLDFLEQRSCAEPNTGCLTWSRAVSTAGYGVIALYAHRLAWEIENGPIAPGLVVDHLCRNRLCVNPSHLDVVSHRVNILRGESPSARNARSTHCINGHEWTEENTYVRHADRDRDAGHRLCKACGREWQRKHARRP